MRILCDFTQLEHRLMQHSHQCSITSDEALLLQGLQCQFQKNADFLCLSLYSCKAGTQKKNWFEEENGILKARWKSQMQEYNIPKRLWDYLFVTIWSTNTVNDCTGTRRCTRPWTLERRTRWYHRVAQLYNVEPCVNYKWTRWIITAAVSKKAGCLTSSWIHILQFFDKSERTWITNNRATHYRRWHEHT